MQQSLCVLLSNKYSNKNNEKSYYIVSRNYGQVVRFGNTCLDKQQAQLLENSLLHVSTSTFSMNHFMLAQPPSRPRTAT